jgi:hypothetical protein
MRLAHVARFEAGRRLALLANTAGVRAKVGSVSDELIALTIADGVAWRAWLQEHYGDDYRGVWLTLAKKGAAAPTSLTYDEALEEALCHGWIDGQIRGRRYIQLPPALHAAYSAQRVVKAQRRNR